MAANWTTLYVKLNGEGEQSETQMKRIGNVNLKTKDISLYTGGYEHYKAGELYYVDSNEDYQRYYK